MDRTITDTSCFGSITFLLADWQGKLLPFFGSVHINRLRHCYINLGKMDGKQIATVCNTKDLIVQWSKLYPDDN